VVRGATVRIDQNDLARIHTVHRHQLPDEDLVRAVLVHDLETEGQRITHLGGGHDIAAAAVGDLHGHVGRVHGHLLGKGGLDVPVDSQVDLVGHALVGQVVLAGHGQAEVGAGDDLVVVLDDDVVDVSELKHIPSQA
jgi:hypothetical protein